MRRRELLTTLGGGALAAAWGRALFADAPKQNIAARTHVYKTVDGCELKADVWEPTGFDSPRLVLVYFHGGALIMGSRSPAPSNLAGTLLERGYAIVSFDYRLAPETRLAGIIDDVRDALRWVRERGPALFKADPQRVAVLGESAGGYLTLMAGFCVEPRPQALVSYFGYGDIIADWYAKPDDGYKRGPKITRERAMSVVGKGVPPCGEQDKHRFDFYLYCRQNGRWPVEVSGIDPHKEPNSLKPFCPIRNVTLDYPPTLLCHGMKDEDVPYAQSSSMADELARVGVAHELIPVPNAGHGFAGASAKVRDLIRRRTLSFLEDHLHPVGRK